MARIGGAKALTATIAVVLVAVGLGLAARRSRLPARSSSVSSDVILGTVDPRASVDVTLVLRPRDPIALHAYLDGLAGRSGRARLLRPSAFGARFGPSDAAIRRIRRALTAGGLTIATAYPQRTAIRARGSARAVERLFGVPLVEHLVRLVTGETERFRAPAPASKPTIPLSMRPDVSAILGLSDRATAVPFHHLGEVPAGGLTPTEVAAAYGIAPLHEAGVTGAGQTIAVVSYATFDDAELDAYDQHFDLSGPPVEHVPVAGGTTKADLEADLDVEVIRAIAPQAQILNFEAPNGRASMGDVIDAIVTDGRAKVISISWGFCAQPRNGPERVRDQQSIDAAVASGTSIFVASGDAGAYDCQRNDPQAVSPTVDWPSSSDGVVAVGGTRLFLTKSGGYAREFGWEDVLSDAGSGGGFSSDVPLPPWQRGPGVQTEASTGMRQIPDVARPADPDSGFFVVGSDPSGQLTDYQVGGTSAAAPFWAASTLLMEQYGAKNGAPALGAVGPALYAVAGSAQPFPPFHDVVRGGNRLYACAAGWDAATGWGSPDVFALARDLVARTKG